MNYNDIKEMFLKYDIISSNFEKSMRDVASDFDNSAYCDVIANIECEIVCNCDNSFRVIFKTCEPNNENYHDLCVLDFEK